MINIVLAILLIALVVLLVLARNADGAFNLHIAIVVVLTIVAVILRATVFRQTEKKMVHRYAAAVGYVLGQKVAGERPERIIVMQTPDYDPDFKGRSKAQLNGFKKGLSDDSVELVIFSPEVPANISDDDEKIENYYNQKRWRQEFIAWYGKQEGIDAIVSFTGLPQFRQKGTVKDFPPIYMRHTGRHEISELTVTEAGKVKGYIQLRPDLTSEHQVAPTASLEKVFKSRFRWTDLQ